MTNFTEEQVEAIMCLWEAFDVFTSNNALRTAQEQYGIAQLRSMFINESIADACNSSFKYVSSDDFFTNPFDYPFDWEFCPVFLNTCIEVDYENNILKLKRGYLLLLVNELKLKNLVDKK